MHKLLSILFIFLSFLAFASCSKNDGPTPEPDIPQTAAKTIFVFMPYTGGTQSSDLYISFLTNLKDMETSINQNGGLGNNHLIVYISKNSNVSHLIDFKYKKGRCVRDTLKTYSSASYTTISGMTSILNDMKQYAPAEQYAAIIGCHGEGWLPKNNITRYFGGSKYKIDVADLAESIHNVGVKMQFMLFDDCYMSGVEVAYDLRGATDVLIASTSEMMGYGMPYHKILKYLMIETPDYASLCKDFRSFYDSYTDYNGRPMNYGTIAVTDINKIAEMAEFMKAVNSIHTFDMDKIDEVQDLDVLHYTPTVYFDFGSYLRVLCGDDIATYTEATKLLEKLVPYKDTTGKIYSWNGNRSLELKEFSGLTISDPSEYSEAINTKTHTAWWKATH